MRGALIGLVLLAACYDPAAPADVPCSPLGACPADQMCVSGICVLPGGLDAGSGIADQDHDGVADSMDNCPSVANADQVNEDGDRFGDACDPCPQIKDDVGADGDVDHIGDLCDPNPGMMDAVWVYNNFHAAALPPWSRSLNWQVVTDQLQANAPPNNGGNVEYMFVPFTVPTLDRFSASATVIVSQVLGTTGDHSAAIEVYDMAMDKSVSCGLDQVPAGASGVAFIDDESSASGDQSTPLPWVPGAAYRLTLTRRASQYTCVVVGPQGTATLSRTSSLLPRAGDSAVDIWAYGSVALFGSVEVIGPK